MQDFILTSVPLETIEQRFSNVVDQKFQSLLSILQQQQEERQPKDYLSRKEAAKLLGISLVTLSDWTKTGKIQGYRIGSRVRYKSAELETSLSAIKTTRRAA